MSGHNRHIALAVALSAVAALGVPGGRAEAAPAVALDEPHVLHGGVGDVIVRIRGGLCSGTPITGTRYVVTAAHCVLTRNGKVTVRGVVRDDVVYTPVGVLVDTRYHDDHRIDRDAAILVMDEIIPGPSARLAARFPSRGDVTLAGLQPLDSDGTLLRGEGPHDLPTPKGATGNRIVIEVGPAGCVESVRELEVSTERVTVHCGLIPGASGGGLFAEVGGEHVLVGVTSTVSADISRNGIVPLASVHELLDNQSDYFHPITRERTERERLLAELT